MGIINNKTIFCNYIIFFQVVSDVSCLNSSISEGESGLSSERREKLYFDFNTEIKLS